MLNILTSNNLSNVLVIVTRYFGGILLGTGGLVRAYSEVASKALEKSEKICMELGIEAEIEVNYQDLQKLKYYLEKRNLKILDTVFNETIKVKFEILEQDLVVLIKNKENVNFKIISYNIAKNKYIEKYQKNVDFW